MIKIWQSYSCNNSASYRLIARFADAEHASRVAGELRLLLRAHAAEVDANPTDVEVITQAQLAFGERYGFTWNHVLAWGTGPMVGNEPAVVLEGEVMVLHHGYCSGFHGLLPYLAAHSTALDHEQGSSIPVTVLCRPLADAEFETELSIMFELFVPADPDDQQFDELLIPWKADHHVGGSVAWFRDPGTVAFHVPIDPRDLAHLKQWLVDRRVDRPVIQIGDTSNLTRLRAIARARCTSCGGALEYLDPRLHDIETPQLVCRPCGGFYDLEAFT